MQGMREHTCQHQGSKELQQGMWTAAFIIRILGAQHCNQHTQHPCMALIDAGTGGKHPEKCFMKGNGKHHQTLSVAGIR